MHHFIAVWSRRKDANPKKIYIRIENKKAIILLNKIDEGDLKLEQNEEIIKSNKPTIKISAKTRQGIDELYEKIIELFSLNQIEVDSSEMITNIRHKNQIDKAVISLQKALNGIESYMPIDIIAVPIKEALEELSEITGENVSEDIISEIFSKFCLGK